MPNYRRGRVNDSVKNEISEILRDVKDPRISGVLITVVGVDVTGDLKYAKVYYSYLGECDERELAKGLKSSAAFMRSCLAKRLNMRVTPELTFILDQSMRRASDIAAVMKSVEEDLKKHEEDK